MPNDPTLHPKYGEAIAMKDRANSNDDYTLRCFSCNTKVFYVACDSALMEGHIYSEDGTKEFRISQMCEFCFDKTADEFENNESMDYLNRYFH